MVSPEHANDVKTEIGGVAPDEIALLAVELCLDLRQLLEYLYADVDEAVDIQSELHEIEEEGDVLLDGQVRSRRVGGAEGAEHVDDLGGALPRDHVLVVIAEVLELLGDGLEVELAARVLFHLAALGHVDAELFAEELADLVVGREKGFELDVQAE